ncbi:MAG: hypothetical protein AAGG72_06570, partial [Pseudomonadota bacterium]
MTDDEKVADVLPPKIDTSSSDNPDKSPMNIVIGDIANYTDRPDLFIEAVEKHDPGFIKEIN